MIYGITHTLDGKPRIRRAVVSKVAIGLSAELATQLLGKTYKAPMKFGPDPTEIKLPSGKKLSIRHFIVLKLDGADWAVDEEKTERYAAAEKIPIVLLDDEVEKVFSTECAWYKSSGKLCSGDGEKAIRKNKDGLWLEHTPCANHGCKEWEEGLCGPTGRLYFMYSDYPELGPVAKLDTTGFQSISEIHTALEQLRSVTAGRLQGIPVNLFVRYVDNKTHGGTKPVVGLRLSAADMKQLADNLVETAAVFQRVQHQLAGRIIEPYEDPDTDSRQMHREFYPASEISPAQTAAPVQADPEAELKAEISRLLKDELKTDKTGVRWNDAKVQTIIGQFEGRLPDLLAAVKKEIERRNADGNSATSSRENAGTHTPPRPERGSSKESATPSAAAPAPPNPQPQTQPRPRPAQSGFGF